MEEINQFIRTEMLIGKENMKKLHQAKVAIFGIGGVGSYVVEGLARVGIGEFILVDGDVVSRSNLNRQIIATYDTIGKPKVEVEKERILKINRHAKVTCYHQFFLPTSEDFFDATFDYIIDAIDTVASKIELVTRAKIHEIPILSCMGTGNKLDPTQFEITDLYKTSVCPLARVMRKELKKKRIEKLKVLYSKEESIKPDQIITSQIEGKRQVPGSISFVPAIAGLMIAGEVVKDILNKN